jgi:hypothetical protein
VRDLETIVAEASSARGLGLRADLHEPGWTFWELRTLDRHRVVGLFRPAPTTATPGDLDAEVRAAISRNFRRSWWRGLACGVVVEGTPEAWTPADLTPMVDVHERNVAIIQWLVGVATDASRAVAMHTWEEVWLSPVYRETVQALEADGLTVARAVRQKDGLMRLLTGASAAAGVAFPEFHDSP